MKNENAITIVIPTKNRAYTLEKVLPSYYRQKHVSQIVFVDDCSADESVQVIENCAKNFPEIKTTVISNKIPQGAARSRNRGVKAAVNDYVLFGEDDAFLSENYAEILLKKLKSSFPSVRIVSGRLISMSPGEDPMQSIDRFGNGNFRTKKLFSYTTCSHIPNAYFEGDIYLPLTHALILTTKDLLLKFPFDPFYSKENAYREESDFQMHAFSEGYDILVTNETHCMHLHPSDVKKGGHRTTPLKSLFYKIYYTNYFYDKYYNSLKTRCYLILPKFIAKILYSFALCYEFGFACLFHLKKKLFKIFLIRNE